MFCRLQFWKQIFSKFTVGLHHFFYNVTLKIHFLARLRKYLFVQVCLIFRALLCECCHPCLNLILCLIKLFILSIYQKSHFNQTKSGMGRKMYYGRPDKILLGGKGMGWTASKPLGHKIYLLNRLTPHLLITFSAHLPFLLFLFFIWF